jgi:hypothetical protein
MTPTSPPSRPPTATELLAEPVVIQAMEDAWQDSLPADPMLRHGEGGWIYLDTTNGQLLIRRAPAGLQTDLDLSNPPLVPGAIVVGTFHTHPNPTAAGWDPRPSLDDQTNAQLSGVPWLIRADNGYHSTGPPSRRGGLAGGPGFPP